MRIAIALTIGVFFLVLIGVGFDNWLLGILAGIFFAVTNFFVLRPKDDKKQT
ncbi:hypothetical protein ACFOLA_05505 [Salinicoccus hispanicus]|uniref:Uncharacterized protein n=1 Tax=Salinicoccus hispanicus TaxID=157225 RepID=A0A6N8TYZ0_9STAP|nr:hypothetical protein [Salinicoccus hispanicus]MXQ51218.1 hypothetical protein [Salinicoccus hispanicus]